MVDFKPLDFAGFVENFNYYYHVFVANALSIGFKALDFVSALSWTWKLISFVIVVLFFKFILNFLIFLLFLPFKIVFNFLRFITKIIKGVANGLITITSQILDWTIWPIQFPVKLAEKISNITKKICNVTFRNSKSFSDFVDSLILRLKRFGMCRSDKGFYDCLKIVFDLCVGFVIGCSTPGVYASAVIYAENVDNQAFASAMKYSALFVGWLYHLVCTHWIISSVLVVYCSVVQYIQSKIGGGGGGHIGFVMKSPNMCNLSLFIGFYVSSEKLIPHSFGVLNLSLFMGFLANSINILRNISHSFGTGTFIIIVAVAAFYFFGFPNLKFE